MGASDTLQSPAGVGVYIAWRYVVLLRLSFHGNLVSVFYLVSSTIPGFISRFPALLLPRRYTNSCGTRHISSLDESPGSSRGWPAGWGSRVHPSSGANIPNGGGWC